MLFFILEFFKFLQLLKSSLSKWTLRKIFKTTAAMIPIIAALTSWASTNDGHCRGGIIKIRRWGILYSRSRDESCEKKQHCGHESVHTEVRGKFAFCDRSVVATKIHAIPRTISYAYHVEANYCLPASFHSLGKQKYYDYRSLSLRYWSQICLTEPFAN